MKILYFLADSHYFSKGKGGAVSHALGVIEGLVNNNIMLTVSAEKNIEDFLPSGISEKIELFNPFYSKKGILNTFKAINRTFVFAQSNHIDIVLIRKNIYTIFFSFLHMLRLQKKYKLKIIWEVNGLTAERYQNNFFGKFIYYFLLNLNKLSLNDSTLIYTVTDRIKLELVKDNSFINYNKIIVIPNGCPSYLGAPKTNLNIGYNLLFFGKLTAYNNFELIIKALESLNSKSKSIINLDIIGFGYELPNILNLIDNIHYAKYHGAMDLIKLHKSGLITKNTIGLIPMKGGKNPSANYGSPIKLFDYYSLGIPVICSDNTIYPQDQEDVKEVVFEYDTDDLLSFINEVKVLIHKLEKTNFDSRKSERLCAENSWASRMSVLIKSIEK